MNSKLFFVTIGFLDWTADQKTQWMVASLKNQPRTRLIPLILYRTAKYKVRTTAMRNLRYSIFENRIRKYGSGIYVISELLQLGAVINNTIPVNPVRMVRVVIAVCARRGFGIIRSPYWICISVVSFAIKNIVFYRKPTFPDIHSISVILPNKKVLI
jgi:uncharacterized membrane protein YjgN (DUF898 family)